MRIQNNLIAINAWRMASIADAKVARNIERLSSGFRINRAADDAAGLAISEKMRTQIRGLQRASKNALDGISLIQTAEGALTGAHAILQRMRELAVQASNGTNDDSLDRAALDLEFQQLKKEIDDIAKNTNFNGMYLLNGQYGKPADGNENAGGLVLQVGPNQGNNLRVHIESMSCESLGITDVSIADLESAQNAITSVHNAVNRVSLDRAYLGAIQNRLEFKIEFLDISAENLMEAESRIRDADLAREMTEFVKNNIIRQAAYAMLAQANALPNVILQLLNG